MGFRVRVISRLSALARFIHLLGRWWDGASSLYCPPTYLENAPALKALYNNGEGISVPGGRAFQGIEPLCCERWSDFADYPDTVAENFAADCNSNCLSNKTLWELLTNGVCDDGEFGFPGAYNLNCLSYNFDAGACGTDLSALFADRDAYNYDLDVCSRHDFPRCARENSGLCYQDCGQHCFNLDHCGRIRSREECLQKIETGNCNNTAPSNMEDLLTPLNFDCPKWERFRGCSPETYEIPVMGLFPTEGAWTGGVEARLAVEMAVDEINNRSDFFHLGTDQKVRLHLHGMETACDATRANLVVAESMYRTSEEIAGVIGGGCSSVCEVFAGYAAAVHLPQVAYGCSSPVFGQKRSEFSYFTRTQSSEGQVTLLLPCPSPSPPSPSLSLVHGSLEGQSVSQFQFGAVL
ncbi:hypothetical protein CYMTET_21031 [Cymbomonas tetramitiformis]|uniref:Receptor ligand binding region domain-containing protein n=1 Tax=Cymbomonas tetramitiformis TaxID=36881 RepID=A0AAE0G452_9CHLO|nr:hypothetical protein CYMTET_21031 [Cymbomonas tetramitiformis]